MSASWGLPGAMLTASLFFVILVRRIYAISVRRCGQIRPAFSRQDGPAVTADVLRVFNMVGKIGKDIYLEHGKYSASLVNRVYGSFSKMFAHLGLPSYKKISIASISKEDILAEMKMLIKRHGKLTARIQRKESKYSESVINFHFGSFNNMLDSLGVDKNKCTYSDDDILYDLKLLYYYYGYLSSELITEHSIVSYPTCTSRFGYMPSILKLLHIDANYKRDSSGSLKIEWFLKNVYDIPYEKEKTWKWLVNPDTKHRLWVDFFVPHLNICIEYDGEQHYTYIRHFHSNYSNFLANQKLDQLKDQLVREHGFEIYRIRYDDDIETSLDNIFS